MSFMGIEIGRRGINAHQSALETTGHNISNADNDNYSRQRVLLRSTDPLYMPSLNRAGGPGMIGQGVEVEAIKRIRDQYTDDRIVGTTTNQHYWAERNKYLYQMEQIFNEPTDNSIRSGLDNLWAAWQEVSKFPEDISHREVLIEKANALTARVKDTFTKLDNLRWQANEQLNTTTKEINSLAETIRMLNTSILKSETAGDNPNDLWDRRDQAVEELSRLVNITVARSDKDEFMVYVGEQILVQGDNRSNILFEPDPENDGLGKLVWEHNQESILPKSGRVQALYEIRDLLIKENISKIDLLAVNLMDITNEIHRDGFGLSGRTNIPFFEDKPITDNVNGNFDLNNDGVAEVTAVFRVSGVNKVDAEKPVGVDGVLTFHANDRSATPFTVAYRADETLQEVIRKINETQKGIVAYINHDNQLSLKADMSMEDDWKRNFMIRHIEDSGELMVGYAGLLSGSGPAGAFDMNRIDDISKFQSPPENISFTPRYHAASWIKVADAITYNTTLVSAARGKDVGGTGDYNTPNGSKDGTNALLIANALKHRDSMIGQAKNPSEFYNGLISKLGTQAQTARNQTETHDLLIKDLLQQRQSVSGVNLDEEMANMVKYQHGYNASAKVLSVMDEMLDVLMGLGR